MTHHRRRTFALIACLAVTALILGVMGALAVLRAANDFTDTAQSMDCPLRTASTEDPTLLAITQAPLEAHRVFDLYSFDGVSDEARVVGSLEPGDPFCLSEEDLDWGMTLTESAATVAIGFIRTPQHPEGVYSAVVGSIPSLHLDGDREGSGHRLIPFRVGQGWAGRPADSPVLPAPAVYAASVGAGGASQQVTGLRAGVVRSLY